MCSILVIDDEETILNIVKLALTRFDYEVETADDGSGGIRKFDSGDFDLVITDIRMPGVDGNMVVNHIRNSNKKKTPIIGISGTPWLLDKKSFNTVISKPFPLKTLVDNVQRLTA